MSPILLIPNLFFFSQKGFCYTSWRYNGYMTQESDSSLSLLKRLNAEWVALLVTWYQDSAHIPYINPSLDSTSSDTSLIHAINRIHSLNMEVTLKLHIDCKIGELRGDIRPDSGGIWFQNYLRRLKHYAQLANLFGVEQFNIGTELEGTTRNHETEWRRMVDTVSRGIAPKPLFSLSFIYLEWKAFISGTGQQIQIRVDRMITIIRSTINQPPES